MEKCDHSNGLQRGQSQKCERKCLIMVECFSIGQTRSRKKHKTQLPNPGTRFTLLVRKASSSSVTVVSCLILTIVKKGKMVLLVFVGTKSLLSSFKLFNNSTPANLGMKMDGLWNHRSRICVTGTLAWIRTIWLKSLAGKTGNGCTVSDVTVTSNQLVSPSSDRPPTGKMRRTGQKRWVTVTWRNSKLCSQKMSEFCQKTILQKMISKQRTEWYDWKENSNTIARPSVRS